MSDERIRLDALVQQTAGVSLSKAQGLIHTGKVAKPDGEKLTKPGMQVDPELALIFDEGPRFVSRGGHKLEAAVTEFPISISGKVAIDLGASTGGFTDCLLRYEASKVYAVDVAYGQLDWKLRQNPRVVVIERTNARNLSREVIPEPPQIFTIDCSFISLRLLLDPLRHVLAEEAEGIILIKPQFEAGRDEVGKGGVIRDPDIHETVVRKVSASAEGLGFIVNDVIPSPLLGPAGNREFLAHLKWPGAGGN